jgi:hypothetical protein
VRLERDYQKRSCVLSGRGTYPEDLPFVTSLLVCLLCVCAFFCSSYNRKKDSLRCVATPYYGPNRWKLPSQEIPFPADDADAYKYFARFLLEGTCICCAVWVSIYAYACSLQAYV